MILSALDKINSLVNKVNKLDARIRKSSKGINENNKDCLRSSTDTPDFDNTPVTGQKVTEGVLNEQVAIPQHTHIIPIDLDKNSPLIPKRR